MNETTKPWYLSKTVIAGLVAVLVSTLGAFGIGLPDGQQETVTELVLQIITALAGIATIAGRLTAKKGLTK